MTATMPRMDDTRSEDASAEAASFFRRARPTSGDEAFASTTWSVLMQMNEGGSTIFTVQFLEDGSCRFSDVDAFGSWECKKDFVVFEKPKGFFDATLLLSARLAPPKTNRYA